MKKWTEDEIERLEKMVSCGLPRKIIAQNLGRSTSSVKNFCEKNRLLISEHRIRLEDEEKKCGGCGKRFFHKENKYCSMSCAAKVNNSKFPKRKKRTCRCLNCQEETANKKYCNNTCQSKHRRRVSVNAGTAGPTAWKNFLIDTRGWSCEMCGLSSWNGSRIPIEMDHINGDAYDNSEDNLRLLCPNCHAQTPTYKNKNRESSRKYRKKYYKK